MTLNKQQRLVVDIEASIINRATICSWPIAFISHQELVELVNDWYLNDSRLENVKVWQEGDTIGVEIKYRDNEHNIR